MGGEWSGYREKMKSEEWREKRVREEQRRASETTGRVRDDRDAKRVSSVSDDFGAFGWLWLDSGCLVMSRIGGGGGWGWAETSWGGWGGRSAGRHARARGRQGKRAPAGTG